MLKYQTLIEGS